MGPKKKKTGISIFRIKPGQSLEGAYAQRGRQGVTAFHFNSDEEFARKAKEIVGPYKRGK